MVVEGRIPGRALLLLPGGFALLAGLNAALSLLGLPAPVDSAGLDQVHGVLLVLGFVGTMVALERAVAAGRWWCYCSPAALGAGGVLLAGPAPRTLSGVLLLVGCSGLIAVYVPLWRRSTDVAVLVQAGGAVLATGAAVLWLGHVPVPDLFPFLAGFLVLTITGERLELARVAMVGASAETLLAVVSAVTVTGAVVALMWPSVGYAVLGAALLATTMWLARYDVARRTVRAVGLPRFMAVCLLAGYAWLAVPGAVWLLHGPVFGGRGYDAVVHAVMLGFVLSMIMAHAPVILPAVIRRPLPYTPVMYVPVALLHLSLLLRIAIGDGRDIEWAVRAGGLGNIVAVLAFVAVAVASAVRARGGSATPAAVRPGVVA